MGFEPTTNSLEGCDSTTELRPRGRFILTLWRVRGKASRWPLRELLGHLTPGALLRYPSGLPAVAAGQRRPLALHHYARASGTPAALPSEHPVPLRGSPWPAAPRFVFVWKPMIT